jgi:hypothetical protein
MTEQNSTKIDLTEPIRGSEGDQIFLVTFVDEEDSEDTRTEIWRAKDEDHLSDEVKKDYVGIEYEDEDDAPYDPVAEHFDDSWGISIIPRLVGSLKS